MQLSLQDFTSLVRAQAMAASASCSQLLDLTVGSVLRAIFEANASVGLWIQWLIMEVLSTTRAATSNGTDLDSWVADFGMMRLPATPATGQVTFSRASAGFTAVIPVGALVRTGTDTNAQAFAVSTDVTNAAWTGGGYRLAASDLRATVPVIAQTPGQASNVQAGAVVLLSSAIPGVDSVTNAGPMQGGLNAEADAALRARFSGFLDSRTRATAQAVTFAIQSLRQNLSFAIAERVDTSGAVRPGHFTVTVDDGTGAPSPALLEQVGQSIEAVRPIGGTFSVRAPLVIGAAVAMTVSGPAGVSLKVTAAVLAYVNALSIGAPLIFSRLYQVAYDADPTVNTISELTVNGLTADLDTPSYGLVRATTVAVSA